MTDDAVVVIPGIMGTELIDAATGKLLWGMSPALLARLWTAPARHLKPLGFDPENNTVVPGRLLRLPSFAPVLAGIEPYSRLVTKLRSVVRHPSAVTEFGYDWRRPVVDNARLLAEAIDRHLSAWRAQSDRPDAQVHLVAHSMGGLLCRALAAIPGATDHVGSVITLGTPFEGAAKAALLLATGQGSPLRAQGMQQVAVTMPGIYDLLPSYRCVDEGTTARCLTAADIGGVGASTDLAAAAFAQRNRLAAVALPSHRPLIGVAQRTMCSLTLEAGCVEPQFHTFAVDADGALARHSNGTLRRLSGLGDGTVPRNSAVPPHHREPAPLPQQHGAIARTDEAIAFVVDRLLHRDFGPRLGGGEIGVSTPDVVRVGTEFEVEVSGVEHPNDIRTTVFDAATGARVAGPHAQRQDGRLVVVTSIFEPGLYRFAVAGGATSAVTQLVLAVGDGDR
ncbi:alpha/beta fold hydrolase [Nocardia sp. CA-120079]|uniref:alpha/beta fold hydrolase n=1 Tax=Nocardia sp. CA-120079 TaxID=3239974 RepID=UPI003D991690